MKIVVYDVAAENGGALSILNNVYDYAVLHKEIDWVFILSLVKYEPKENIVVENFPKVKKGWLHRLKFDKIDAIKLIKKHKPDMVLNMQNIALNIKYNQVLYMHQSLPFVEYKFPIKDTKMWIYQNVIGEMIKHSFKKADKIIVQTKWIKDAIIQQTKEPESKIEIKTPYVDISKIEQNTTHTNTYFYPASGLKYKNHGLIIEACRLLKKQGFNDYKIIFTLNGDENENIKSLFSKSKNEELNIEWVGKLPIEQVYKMYSITNLVFPSYIETFGLPLLEARLSNAKILAANTAFAREILDGYSKAYFFNYDDYEELANLIINLSNGD